MDEVSEGLALIAKPDRRYLRAGLGFGGSCLPKDARALAAFSEAESTPSAMFRAALEVNRQQPKELVRLAKQTISSLRGKTVAVLGLAFKPKTDDVRESVAIELVRLLLEEGAIVRVYDPAAMDNARARLGDAVAYSHSVSDCLEKVDCCFLATEWEEFRRITPARFKKLMGGDLVVDGRRVYSPERFLRAGVRLAKLGTWQGR